MRLTQNQHWLLCEALRRFECFHRDQKWTIKNLTEAWTGLGSKTNYKPVLNAGLMVIAGTYYKGVSNWFRLTNTGAKIVKKWHDAGYVCKNYELVSMPPLEV